MSRAIKNSSSSTRQRLPESKVPDSGKAGVSGKGTFFCPTNCRLQHLKKTWAAKIHVWTAINSVDQLRMRAIFLSRHMASHDYWSRTTEWFFHTLRSMSVAQAAVVARVLG